MWALLGLLVVATAQRDAQAEDWIVLNPLQIEVLARYDGRWYESGDLEDYFGLSQGGLSFTQTGYSYAPGILSFTATVAPLYRHVGRERGDERFTAGDFVTDYDVGISVLSDTVLPVSAQLGASKFTNFSALTLGSTAIYSNEQHFVGAKWDNDYIPVTFRYKDWKYKHNFRSGLTDRETRRDEHGRKLSLKAQSSKMTLSAGFTDLDDRRPDTNNDFQTVSLGFFHRFHWGTGSRLQSSVTYNDRRGFNPLELFRWEETAQIQHGEHFRSNTRISFQSQSGRTETDSTNGMFALSHHLYTNLTTTFTAQATSWSSPVVKQKDWRTGLDVRYRKSDLMGVNVNLGLGGYLGRVDRESRGGFNEVIDEPHIVPVSGEVLLDRRFVIQSTVVVTDSSGTLVYEEGFDYELLSLSDEFTQLRVIPGGRISTGETILVSYLALNQPSSKYDTAAQNYSLFLGWKGFTFSFLYNILKNDLISGSDSAFLDEVKQSNVSLAYSRDFERGSLTLSADRRQVESDNLETLNYTFDQSLVYILTDRTRMRVSLTQSLNETDGRRQDLYQAHLSLIWKASRGFEVEPILRVWRQEQELPAEDGRGELEVEYLSAGVRIEWNYRRILFSLTLFRNERDVNQSIIRDDRVMFKLRRRFG